MSILKFRIFATATLVSVGVLLLSSFSSWAKPKISIHDYCNGKATQAYDKCIGAGIDADLCADISNRTYNNCIQRLTGTHKAGGYQPATPSPIRVKPPTTVGNRLPPSNSPSPSNETAITGLEKFVWEAYKNKQADALKVLFSNDYRGAYFDGMKTVDGEIAAAAATNLRDYSLDDMKVVFPSADVAVITYKVRTQAHRYNSGSVWIKKAGKWLCVFHAGIKAQ
jgi:hypothetical protein